VKRPDGSFLPPRDSIPTWLWLIRHAEVEERYQAVFGGRIDMELSARGRKQAEGLAAFLQQHRFDALYASPMKRVQQTLAPCATNGGPTPTLVPELREVDFGVWTGLRWDEVEAKFGISPFSWLHQLEGNKIEGAESAAALRQRLEPWLRGVLTNHSGHQIALFCHGGVIRMLLAILLDWPLSNFAAVEIDYASLTQVVCHPAGARLQLANFSPWRQLAGAKVSGR
jgi:broad specificity phosphatase PhoE